ncbi:MAG: peptidoglycan DD-metalloendopeptidase family protein [Saprospiraceae bacterium]|nr:peptidoglycan DD-metalloendopeptidase family protein [Saprospiraceae bacterium]
MDIKESIKKAKEHFLKRKWIGYNLLIFGILAGGYCLDQFTDIRKVVGNKLSTSPEVVKLDHFKITEPTMKYGFAIDTLQMVEKEIKSGQNLGDLLQAYNIEFTAIEQLVANSKEVFDVRHLRAGKKYTILAKDTLQKADYFVYEPSVYEYFVFDLKDKLNVTKVERPVDSKIKAAAGVIESSLWNAMVDNGLSYEVTSKMEGALQWSIDFHHIQKDDEFRLVFDQNYIEGQEVGVGQLYLANYKRQDKEFYSVWYESEDGKIKGYYDLEGRTMKAKFLKSPVKYSRISSYYNLNRFHPILKRRRPHYGTDYAAPYGTPIYAVGNGVITRASYTNGNGNYVKIKHDDTYETQYLHMQKFAKGIKPGVFVTQGQVIGYVGSTGLATGPHVCFRFWKNGKQVNHLRLNFPEAKPLPDDELPKFQKVRDEYLKLLEGVQPIKIVKAEEEQTEEHSTTGNP